MSSNDSPDPIVPELVQRIAQQLDTSSELTHELLAQLGRATTVRVELTPECIIQIEQQYCRLGAEHTRRFELLRVLAAAGTADALAVFTRFVVDDPPNEAQGATLAMVPLFQRRDWPIDALFPQLLDGLKHGSTATVVLDLANFVTRQKLVSVHPAAGRVETLAELLGRVVGMLGRIEDQPQEFARLPGELTERVSEGLSLVVALCDTLGLIGDPTVSGKLYQARELRHRRIRVEASAALARLGDPAGVEGLVELASEPVVRTRALAYLDELGKIDQAKPEHRTPSAQACGLLAAWLAQPLRYGLSPRSVEIVDERRLFWPGFQEPVDCFLVRYEMPIGDPPQSGIGLVGPFIAAAPVNLADLNPEAIYAFYAGAAVEHDAIVEIAVDKLSLDQLSEWIEFKKGSLPPEFVEPQLLWWGQFFEHQYWVAQADRDGHRVLAVADSKDLKQLTWYPLSDRARALAPADWYALHKGRVMLETFNPQDVEGQPEA